MAHAATLPDLLRTRARASTNYIGFLAPGDAPSTTLSYADLFARAERYARGLLASGLQPHASDVVLGVFEDHESYVLLFWGCCLAGIPFCPLAALHPDPKRQADLFAHLQSLFDGPLLVTSPALAETVNALAPTLKISTLAQLDASEDAAPLPASSPSAEEPVCYVLTSGSTGKPKAVSLRHSQILAACAGKSAHHGTSASSRFLNWIAFDHVASITEIHVHALLVDAVQYHISPTAIIVDPKSLLDLCSKLEITYSFAPNFLMARILKDDAIAPLPPSLDLSRLSAFISGGESVPMPVGVAFADLLERFGAKRNVLRAGFGMSETCAGSIYDTTDIPRTVDPAGPAYLNLGTCVPGMSMRVVSATGGLCAPGEPGQLHVSGANVFTHYVRNPSATSEAFTPDGWFVTGDLGYLDVSGHLHMLGRDKELVNINGAKVSSKDVETYLDDANLPGGAPDNLTAAPVRIPGADTETYLIFYKRDLAADEDLSPIRALNDAIRDACTVLISAAPHAVLPLPSSSFVATALGKVSRAQLANAYLRGDYAAIEDKFKAAAEAGEALDLTDPIQVLVRDAVVDVLELSPGEITHATNLFDTGASSMHLMRLKKVVEERMEMHEIPTIELLRRPRVGALCAFLASLRDERAAHPREAHVYQPLVCLEAQGSKPPVFLIHPGVGEILVFLNMAHRLQDDRPVYAIRAKGFDYDDQPFKTLDETVAVYADAIEKAYPAGPYYVAGYSYGGAIAFRIAQRLEAKGKKVEWLGILNLPPHIQFRMHELSWTEVLFNVAMFLSLFPPQAIPATKAEFRTAFPGIAGGDAEPSDPLSPITWLLSRADQARLAELDLQLGAFTRWIKVAYEINRTGREFLPSGKVAGALTTVFCAVPLESMGTREEYKNDRLSQWVDFTGPHFELIDVDGEHYTMLSKENSASFADKMRDAMHRAEDVASKPAAAPVIAEKKNFDEVPVIDFSLAESDPAKYYEQLRFALEDVGFLVFSNIPGFEHEFQTEVFDVARKVMSKPQEWKDSLSTANSYSLRGYFRADSLPGVHKAYAEAYRFGADLPAPGEEAPFWLKLHEGPNQWPKEEDVPHFRERMNALFDRYHKLNMDLNRHICNLLGLHETGLDEFFPAPTPEFNSAIWHYFACTPEILADAKAKDGFVQGMHEHRDPSTFVTCLIQSRPGLQVQNHQGAWIDVPMVKGGVVCNIGMQLMKLTGGKLVATTHRVNTLKIDEDRFTIPYVLSTKLEKEIVPLPQFANPEAAKAHIVTNQKIIALQGIKDPLLRSGYARLSLMPAAASRLYPKEFEEAHQLGIV
ncbi:acetyl-CoA synthetase-like protein [Punctularia strigosozonata HHB-11173 SS5]|uniref:acetyl-CoA synthetase-like protein n=1 Tax=Punctularia strigosozonata (strain HHB-11173) TaxID=741275 RepID=UPI0004416904|nr:acetyl-CoA synthetase-like protein [Punctularia strigosozonata HHB-11173 SS5]EIN08725.1 acetyl-CoA synthetase-like protein [Punctularia strigosozonata HHB-11173 SS5]